jgi:hypothetical protein
MSVKLDDLPREDSMQAFKQTSRRTRLLYVITLEASVRFGTNGNVGQPTDKLET